jgi:hypothetical protein
MKKTANGNGGEERKEVAYPYYDLEASINFATHIKDCGGSKSPVPKSLLAKQVGLAESTPSFFQRLSAAKAFRIIEGWGSYGLTEIGRKYFYPQSENDKQMAVLTMFVTPTVFSFIVKRFDGEKLPSTEIMGNIVHQEMKVPESWKDRVAQIFARSAQFVGILDAGGFLRYDAAVHTKPHPDATAPAVPTPDTTTASAKAPNISTDPLGVPAELIPTDEAPPGYCVWSFSHKGKQIKVQTPENLPQEVWAKLSAYVQILKPTETEE